MLWPLGPSLPSGLMYIYILVPKLCYNKSEQRNYEQHHKKSLPNNYM